jgi:hypothetical protein
MARLTRRVSFFTSVQGVAFRAVFPKNSQPQPPGWYLSYDLRGAWAVPACLLSCCQTYSRSTATVDESKLPALRAISQASKILWP